MRRHAPAVAAVTLAVLLAGCNGSDPDPSTSTTTATSTPSATTTTSNGPTTSEAPSNLPSDLPSLARQHSREGAIQMAKYFMSAVDRAFVTNDTKVLSMLSTTGCFACQGSISSIETNRKNGVHQDSLALSIDGVLPSATKTEATNQSVDLLIRDRGASFLDKMGKVVHQNKPQKYTARVKLVWGSGNWNVTDLGQVRL